MTSASCRPASPVVIIRNIGLRCNVIDFVTTGIVIDSMRLAQAEVRGRCPPHARDEWNVARLVGAEQQEAEPPGQARTIRVAEIECQQTAA